MPTACTLVDRALEYSTGLEPELQRHFAGCARCRERYGWLFEAPPEVSAALRQRILGALEQRLEPVTPLPSTRVSVLQLALLFGVLALALAAVTGADGLRGMSLAQVYGMAAVIGTALVLICIFLAWQMIPGSRQRFPVGALVAGVGIAFLAAIMLLFPWLEPRAFAQEGWRCSATGLALAVPAAMLFWAVARRGALLSQRAAGATLGAMAGLLGVTVMQVHCAHQEALHHAVWHSAILFVSIGLGTALACAVTYRRPASK